MKYKVGDKVRIRKDLDCKDYGKRFVVPEMLSLAGEVATSSTI